MLGDKGLGMELPPPASAPSFLQGHKASDVLFAIRQGVVAWYSHGNWDLQRKHQLPQC